jgi:hypothetical protein
MVLSHQRINQLTEYGDNFYNAVMAGAQLKVVFRVNDEETADIMSRHFFRTTFDLERPKHVMNKPFTVGHRLHWFRNVSAGSSYIEGTGEGSGTGAGLSSGMSQMYDSGGGSVGNQMEAEGNTNATFNASNYFSSATNTKTEGATEGLLPITEFLPTELFKLDELIHLGMVELLSLPDRTAWVQAPGRPVFKM